MRKTSDYELLREYAGQDNEDAFREIVSRHTDLVYSSALRQVSSPDVARDVAQSVFSDLARKAASLVQSPTTSLVGWLFRSTRFAVLNQLREDRRRRARERQAMENLNPAPEPEPEWESVRPVLDAAIADLDEEDREAVLLRFFKNWDFHAVGRSLGTSDDTAQKRVSRALDRLRATLISRGVTTTASALSEGLTANAVKAAPAGLAVSISATALATKSLAAAATKTIAMTTLQKTLIGATFAVAVGTAVYETRQAVGLRKEVQALRAELTPLKEESQQLEHERDQATRQLAALRQENERLKGNTAEMMRLRNEVTQLRGLEGRRLQSAGASPGNNDPFTQSVLTLTGRASELNQHLERMPEKRIPEMALLNESDWLLVAKDADLSTDEGVRKALRQLRSQAKMRLPLGGALNAYVRANDGHLPSDLSQLKPYFKADAATPPGLDDATIDVIFSRYTMLRTGKMSDFPPDTWIIAEKAPVDREYDSRAKYGNGRSSVMSTGRGEVGDPDDKSY